MFHSHDIMNEICLITCIFEYYIIINRKDCRYFWRCPPHVGTWYIIELTKFYQNSFASFYILISRFCPDTLYWCWSAMSLSKISTLRMQSLELIGLSCLSDFIFTPAPSHSQNLPGLVLRYRIWLFSSSVISLPPR